MFTYPKFYLQWVSMLQWRDNNIVTTAKAPAYQCYTLLFHNTGNIHVVHIYQYLLDDKYGKQ